MLSPYKEQAIIAWCAFIRDHKKKFLKTDIKSLTLGFMIGRGFEIHASEEILAAMKSRGLLKKKFLSSKLKIN